MRLELAILAREPLGVGGLGLLASDRVGLLPQTWLRP
jgi:hypothetical protein